MQNEIVLNIDSNYRESSSPSSSNFQYQLYLPRNMNYQKVSVLRCSFPKTYYMIDSTNNSFTLTDSGGPFTITLDADRNYTSSQLATELKTKMDAASADTYTISLDGNNGKWTFANGTGDFTMDLSGNDDLAKYLGLSAGANVSTASSLTSTNVANLQRYETIQLHSSICRNGLNDVLAYLNPRDTADFDVLNFDPDFKEPRLIHNPETNLHNFSLTDSLGRAINLNGGTVQLSLLVDR
jgi:hypothetical protein